MNIIFKFFNINLALILMFIFAFLCACATFIEANSGTQEAKDLIYNAWYFHLVMLLLTINIAICIFKYKMHQKISLFLIHFSFLFIFLGAILTHFYGFEGIIQIREGNFKDEILSTVTKINISHNNKTKSIDNFKDTLSLDNATIKFIEFSNEANLDYVSSDNANDEAIIKLNFTYQNNLHELLLKEQECNLVQDLNFCFNKTSDGNYINFYIKNNKFYANTNVSLKRFIKGQYEDLTNAFEFSDAVYFHNNFSFNPILLLQHAKNSYVMNGGDIKAIKVEFISVNDKQNIILPLNTVIKHDGYELSWAQESLKLDYKIYLKQFILHTYPASKSPKDYESQILIVDNDKKINTSISMNKVFDYKGIRFFQHSYDEDLKGTTLSANKDLGKTPTYIGYFLLFLGCFLNIFSKNTKKLFKALCILGLLIFSPKINANDLNSHINELNTVIVQDLNDRFLSFYALSNDLCNKLGCPKNNFSEELFKLISDISYVNEAKIIKVKNKKLQEILGINENYAKFSDFYDGSTYKLKDLLKQTYSKGEANFNDFDKELLKVDESVNIFYLIFTGELFKILPDETDFKLYNPFADDLNLQNQKLANEYLSSLLIAKNTNDYTKPNEIIEKIKENQYSFDILPSINQVKAENFLTKIDGFYTLCLIYLAVFFISLFFINKKTNIVFYLTLICFLFHLFLLFLRGFVAGFAPLSNTYESLIYIALTSVLAGLIFRKNLLLTLSILLASAILFTAHLNNINPQITNLVPVLNSPYLSIHVSLISASYGFFALSFLISLIYLINKNDKNLISIRLCIQFGLLLLVCGNFLGAIWANESWGRYWGWDSKETWSLISILIYSILLHLPFSKFYNKFLYASLSMWSFASILMTYFGVNYYLVGKHSYAGEKTQLQSIDWLIISVLILLIFNIITYYKRGKNV